MKKIFTLAIMALMLVFLGCSKDDNNSSSSDIIGEWYLSNEKGYSYLEGEKDIYDDSYSQETAYSFITFNSDKTVVMYDAEEDETTTGTWKISGKKLTITVSGETNIITLKTLNSTTFVINENGTDEDGPWENTYTYTKIK